MTPAQCAARIRCSLRGASTVSALCSALAGHLDALGHAAAASLLVKMGGQIGSMLVGPILDQYGERGSRLLEHSLDHYGDRLWQQLMNAATIAYSREPRTATQLVDALAVLVSAIEATQQLSILLGQRYWRLRRPLRRLRNIFLNAIVAALSDQPDADEMIAQMILEMDAAVERAAILIWQPIEKAVDIAVAHVERKRT